MNPLKDELVECQPWLFQEAGFGIVEDSYDPESFGDSLVTLESAELRVRFIGDRGQVFAQVAAHLDPENWWELKCSCEVVCGQRIELRWELPQVASLSRQNLAALTEHFGPKHAETKREVERRAEERKQAFLRSFSAG